MGKRDERKRQKALDRKRAKRKDVRRDPRPVEIGGSFSFAAQSPIHECLAPQQIFDIGFGNVMISRRLSSGRITVAVFLVDVFCLGVKNALYTTVDPAEYAWMKGRIKSTTSLESIDPCCARKLIEGAVEYAWQFGFEPHPDYRSAKRIFGDIDSAVCATHFEYGKDGKPFYVSGPNDTPAMSERILAALERANGSEGFRYIVVAEPSREPSTF